MTDEATQQQDRREYWRQYQSQRYSKIKAEKVFKRGADPGTLEQYKKAVVELGLQGQKNWRARKKLKQQLYGNSDSVAILDFMHNRAKASARQRGIEFDIDRCDIVLVDKCPLLKVALEYGDIENGDAAHRPSLDRIDNAKGYVKGNVQVVSARANILKRDATLEELVKMGEWAKARLKSSQRDSHQILTNPHLQKA